MYDFDAQNKALIQGVEADLAACFDHEFDTPAVIVEAMKYSLFAGGKRVRPVLMRQTALMMGGDVDSARALSCAIEMIHTYSLIHDDLPAMDDDDLRRGKPTNHVVYGESTAVLAGDALLNFAAETALTDIIAHPERMEQSVRAYAELMKAAGIEGMIGGQVSDIQAENAQNISKEELDFIHAHKTGALITAAVVCGGILGGAEEAELACLTAYGQNLGLAFQIADDILDETSTTETLGKPVGSDEKNHKTTYVTLYGLAESKKMLIEAYHRAEDALGQLDRDTRFLSEMAAYVCERALGVSPDKISIDK
ncbi:MAG: polyprenyl synthetase family protein [Eubacteriaceae bacterium]|nr:polyprenyl synthetase family protein [Eubacteriaceae bacterium]